MENTNPIGELMQATMDNVRNMLKVDTVVGDPIYTPDGITLVPISRISVGVVSSLQKMSCKSYRTIHAVVDART